VAYPIPACDPLLQATGFDFNSQDMSLERSLLSAQGYIELEMPDEALREIDAISSKDQFREEVLQMRLFIVMRARRWEQALSVCARLRATRPEGVTGYIHGAFCLHELGRTGEAKQLLVGGPSTLLSEPTYYYNLGCYDAVLGNLPEAARHLERSFQMDGKFREIAKYDPDLKTVHGLLGK
jgi:predicted Zn-dependent protease